jgi:hypothetical protein
MAIARQTHACRSRLQVISRCDHIRMGRSSEGYDRYRVTLRAKFWEALVDEVRNWRARAGLPNTMPLDALRPPFRKDIPDSANLSPDALQLLFDVFVPAVDVVHAIDDGLPISHERSEHERRGGS